MRGTGDATGLNQARSHTIASGAELNAGIAPEPCPDLPNMPAVLAAWPVFMKLSRLLPFLLTPNIAFAKGGGAVFFLGVLLLPLIVWIVIKVWTFWLRLFFGGRQQPASPVPATAAAAAPVAPEAAPQDTKECPFCAERVLLKAKKCKHCGSDIG